MTFVICGLGALLFLALVGWWREHRELVDATTTMSLAERYHQQQMNDVIAYYEAQRAPAQSQVQQRKVTWLN